MGQMPYIFFAARLQEHLHDIKANLNLWIPRQERFRFVEFEEAKNQMADQAERFGPASPKSASRTQPDDLPIGGMIGRAVGDLSF